MIAWMLEEGRTTKRTLSEESVFGENRHCVGQEDDDYVLNSAVVCTSLRAKETHCERGRLGQRRTSSVRCESVLGWQSRREGAVNDADGEPSDTRTLEIGLGSGMVRMFKV